MSIFQGLGYDLDQEARMFDGIHTGTESTPVTLHVVDRTLQDLQTGATLNTVPQMSAKGPGENGADTRNIVPTAIPLHSYVAFHIVR